MFVAKSDIGLTPNRPAGHCGRLNSIQIDRRCVRSNAHRSQVPTKRSLFYLIDLCRFVLQHPPIQEVLSFVFWHELWSILPIPQETYDSNRAIYLTFESRLRVFLMTRYPSSVDKNHFPAKEDISRAFTTIDESKTHSRSSNWNGVMTK